MSHIISYNRHIGLLFLLIFTTFFSIGCSSEKSISLGKESLQKPTSAHQTLRDNTPEILIPEAPGETVFQSDTVILDVSNTSSGYVVLTYSGENEKVKFQIVAPDSITYTYLVTNYGKPMVFPLTGQNGTYLFSLLESVGSDKDLYAILLSQEIEVSVNNEFLPYLTPNIYANFDSASTAVAKGEELAKECFSDLDVIENIYYYVTQCIVYDDEKAQSVTYGYLPDPDNTLSSGKGICFDYASLMTTMLRSQRIPTKLEVGYAGEVYHAWISCYVNEIGWVDNIIEFDGNSWSLMDPTLAANNKRSAVAQYIGDGSNYIVKYTY